MMTNILGKSRKSLLEIIKSLTPEIGQVIRPFVGPHKKRLGIIVELASIGGAYVRFSDIEEPVILFPEEYDIVKKAVKQKLPEKPRPPERLEKEKSTRAARVENGLCAFCGSKRNLWKFLCDECAIAHRDRQRIKANIKRLSKGTSAD